MSTKVLSKWEMGSIRSAAQLLSLGLHSATAVLNEAKSKHDEGINSIFSQLMPYRVSLASLLTV